MSFSLTGSNNPDWKNEFVLRGGYVSADQSTAGNRGAVSTILDTQLSETLTYNGFNGFSPFASILVNLPTGKSALFGNSRFARMDGDLVDVGSYGEGYNIGPTLGVNIPITASLIATLSAGYTFRGQYNKEALDPATLTISTTDRVRNGSEGTVTFALGYGSGPFSTQGTVSYAKATVSQVNDFGQFDFARYRVGDRLTVSGFLSYQWTDQINTTFDGYYVHSNPNEVLNGALLVTEPINTNSDVYRINGAMTYTLPSGFAFGPTASYLYRNHNSFNSQTLGFTPAKTRYAVGGTAKYAVSPTINLNAKLERIWINESENTGPPAFAILVPQMSGSAWAALVGATVNFGL